MKQYFYLRPEEEKIKRTFLGAIWSLFGPVTSWVDWQVLSET